jgi:hypothetical protein
MIWPEIRKVYPNQWLVIEAIAAHTTQSSQRELEKIAVIEICADGITAMQRYRHLHSQFPEREFYFVNTNREELDIRERQWVGIRSDQAVAVEE